MLNDIRTTKKILIVLLAVGTVVLSALGSSTEPAVSLPSPDKVLQNLKEGNERFVSGKATHPRMDSARLIETSQNGQHPFVTVLTCSDSRLPAELIFDQGIGDIFVVRVAGNVCNTDEVASIEYGTGHLGTPVLVVLGHTGCGAVTAVTTESELHGNIAVLVKNIKSAVEKAAAANPHLCSKELVPEAIKANCWQSVEDLFKTSPAVCEQVRAGKLKVVAAIYNVSTGKVGWLGAHPEQKRFVAAAGEPSDKKETSEKKESSDKKEVSEKSDEKESQKIAKEDSAKEKH